MSLDDIPQIMDIERESFPSMWPQTAYRRELQNRAARYFVVAEERDEPPEGQEASGWWSSLRRIVRADGSRGREHILGVIGAWLLVGETHIVTIAVRGSHRRMGIGERLLIAVLELAIDYDMECVTLEVRKSNEGAQALYAKYGFDRVGLRVRYYTDNNEDAVIMTTPDLQSRSYHALVARLKAEHQRRFADLWT
jgi:ribosomal-protein-alanine N-acetyltransferase